MLRLLAAVVALTLGGCLTDSDVMPRYRWPDANQPASYDRHVPDYRPPMRLHSHFCDLDRAPRERRRYC